VLALAVEAQRGAAAVAGIGACGAAGGILAGAQSRTGPRPGAVGRRRFGSGAHRAEIAGRSRERRGVDGVAALAGSLRITGIAEAIAVAVGLIGIGDVRTVVDVTAHPIAVGIIVGIVRAGVAGIPEAIAVAVGLIGVGVARAVVGVVRDTVAVVIGQERQEVRGATRGILISKNLQLGSRPEPPVGAH
jgi:hypothetical protein